MNLNHIKYWDENLVKDHVVNEISQIIDLLADKKEISFLDVGANVGKFYDILSELYIINKCIMIEPVPELSEYLKVKFKNKKVEIIPKAVISEKNKDKVKFLVNNSENNLGLSKIYSSAENEVDAINFYSFLNERWDLIKTFDFIKIDTENMDYELIEPLYKKLKNSSFRPIIAFENNYKGNMSETRAKSIYNKFLKELNYVGPNFINLPGDVVIHHKYD